MRASKAGRTRRCSRVGEKGVGEKGSKLVDLAGSHSGSRDKVRRYRQLYSRVGVRVCSSITRRRRGREDNSRGDDEQTFLNPMRLIQLQQAHRRSTAGRERLDKAVLKSKMFHPTITARVEERHNGSAFRIDGGEIAASEAITKCTSQSQIIGFCGPAVLLGDDVIDFVRCEGHRFRDQTIFTAVARSQPHRAPQLSRNVRSAHGVPLDLSWSAASALAIRTRCSMY